MAKRRDLKVVDLNSFLSCILCGGYFIDATTITECLHSFCRACIVRYLETSKYCPVCEVQVHKTRPLRCIRSDLILQNIVYKLVPGLYQNEMSRRRELYASQPPEALLESRDEEDRGEGLEHRFIYLSDEMFDLILKYQCKKTENESKNIQKEMEHSSNNNVMQRFMRCPAAIKLAHLKKFIRYKYDIPTKLSVELWYETNLLDDDDYSLMDVAYIYSWKRAGPLQLRFRISECPKVVAKDAPFDKNSAPLKKMQEVCSHSQASNDEAATDGSAATLNCFQIEDIQTMKKSEEFSSDDISKTAVPAPALCMSEKRVSSSSTQHSEKMIHSSKQFHVNSISNCEQANMSNSAPHPENSAHETSSKFGVKNQNADHEEKLPPLKVPKLTIPLTAKIRQQAAYHAEEEKNDSDGDFEGRLVIVEPEDATDEDDDTIESCRADKSLKKASVNIGIVDDYEIDSGRGSDSSSRTEGSFSGDDNAPSPNSINHPLLKLPSLCSDLSKIDDPPVSSTKEMGKAKPIKIVNPTNDFGALDLSTCHRKRTHDRLLNPRVKQVANPAVLDKHHRMTPCSSSPKHSSSFKMLPSVPPQTSSYKKSDHRGGFRYNRGSTFTVINPDPNSCRPKIVIKNLDPKPRHHHHHH